MEKIYYDVWRDPEGGWYTEIYHKDGAQMHQTETSETAAAAEEEAKKFIKGRDAEPVIVHFDGRYLDPTKE